jgi:hypothetical protein
MEYRRTAASMLKFKHLGIPNSKLQLKLLDGNAFQSLGKPTINDIMKQRVEGHLTWKQKHPPSVFISTFNDLSDYSRVV